MNKYFTGLIYLTAVIILFFAFRESFEKLFIKYSGHKIVAIVTEAPLSCDKYNSIKIIFEDKEAEVSISNKNCRERKYKIGQKVELIKHSRFKTPVWPHSQPEIILLIFVFFTIIFYLQYRYRSGYK